MSRTRILLLADGGRASPWLTVDAGGHVLQRGQLTPGERLDGEAMPTVLVVPGTDVLVRWLDLPGRGEAQIAAAAAWALRDDLAVEPERVALALGAPSAGPRLIAAAARPLVEAWTSWAEEVGGPVTAVVPDSLVPPEPADAGTLSAVGFGPRTALRGQGLAFSGETELVEMLADGRLIAPLTEPEAVERAVIAAALNPPVNLIGRRKAAPAAPGRWRRAAVLAGAFVLSPLIVVLAQAGHAENEAQALNARSRAAVLEVFPDLGSDADPAAELGRRLAGAPPPGGTAGVAARLFAALERVDGAELDSLTLDDAGLRATVTYANASDLEALKQAAAAQGLSFTDQSTVEDNGRIVSDMVVGGGA